MPFITQYEPFITWTVSSAVTTLQTKVTRASLQNQKHVVVILQGKVCQ